VEGFEHIVKVAMEAEGFIVSGNLKFPVKRKDKKGREQTHGYEIDLVGAKKDKLVLASVKSYFGSIGVNKNSFIQLANIKNPTSRQKRNYNLYKIFNYEEVRKGVIRSATKRFGYHPHEVEIRLYAGKFRNEDDKKAITNHLGKIKAGGGPIKVFALDQIFDELFKVLDKKTYFNDPVIMTLKAITQAIRQAKGRNGKKISLKKAIIIFRQTLGLLEPVVGILKGLESMKRGEGLLAETAFEKIRKKYKIPLGK
jgi:hypothetical protein